MPTPEDQQRHAEALRHLKQLTEQASSILQQIPEQAHEMAKLMEAGAVARRAESDLIIAQLKAEAAELRAQLAARDAAPSAVEGKPDGDG